MVGLETPDGPFQGYPFRPQLAYSIERVGNEKRVKSDKDDRFEEEKEG